MSTQEHLQFYIDGQWVPPAVPRPQDLLKTATQGVAARLPKGPAPPVDAAGAAARRPVDSRLSDKGRPA